jgi:hypothetical protein
MVFNIFFLKVLICIHIVYFSLVQFRSQGRDRETSGWAQFDWMLDGGSFKAQSIEFWLFCFNRKPTDVSPQKYLSCYILYHEKYFN